MKIISCTGFLLLTVLTLFGCSSSSHVPVTESGEKAPSGCIYGTGAGNRCPKPQERTPDLTGITGAKITREPFSKRGNKDYTVFGQKFQVWRNLDSYTEEGMASWYGPGFHGQKTSNGEHFIPINSADDIRDVLRHAVGGTRVDELFEKFCQQYHITVDENLPDVLDMEILNNGVDITDMDFKKR